MGEESPPATGSERFWFDTVSAVILFLTAIGGAWLPKYLCSHGGHVSGAQSLAFHLGNMLSAGVMLSAGFCHLLADSHRYLLFIGRFPISNFLAATGYIITLLADQVVQFVSDQQEPPPKADLIGSGTGAGGAGGGGSSPSSALLLLRNGGYNKLPSSTAELTGMSATAGSDDAGGASAKVIAGQEGLLTTAVHREAAGKLHDPEIAIGPGAGAHAVNGSRGFDGPEAEALLPAGAGSTVAVRSTAAVVLGRSYSSGGGGEGRDCHASGMAVLLGSGRKLSFATAVLLASALCIHSILEGMALGAQQSMRSTEDIMVAIAAHKGLAAYALGASIMESGASSKRFWTVIGCFSLATPIGIFAGYGMSSAASSKSGAALSALASGTFLYVAFMEVIPKELADGKHRAAKMLAFLLGYSLMSLLAVWA